MKKIFKKIAINILGKEISERYGTESPEIFKKIQVIGAVLVALSGAIATTPVALPAILVAHAANIAFVGGTMVAIGKLPKKEGGK